MSSTKERSVSPSPEEACTERERRFNDIVALKRPDRVPVIPIAHHYFATKVKGISNRDAGYDSALRFTSLKEATIRFGWDFFPGSGVCDSNALDALGVMQIRWPGGDLRDDVPFQFVEDEYLREDEYDEFLADPDGFTLAKVFPRIAGNLAGLGQVGLPPLHWLSNAYFLQAMAGPLVAASPVREALESLLRFGAAAKAEAAVVRRVVGELALLGYPRLKATVTFSAFDLVSDFFRGLKGGSLDIYRNPDRLLALIDIMHQVSISLALNTAKSSGNPRVFIPMHRGSDSFMSEEAFERFYWPSFRGLIEALVEAGLTPMPLFEGSYNSRLKYLARLPPGKVAAHFDHVDRKNFKQMCGEVMCFWGNVPASIMCHGTRQEVKDDVKKLIDLFGDTGALIIDSNQGIPDEAKPENVLALREAVDEYGVF
jgi:hypothetical protein